MDFTRRICWIFLAGVAFGQETASLTGVVLDAASRTPLSGVHVQIVPSTEAPVPFGTMTGNDGRFSFVGVPPGSYTIVPRFPGMVYDPLDPADRIVPTATLAAGESKQIRVGMTHKAVISGRVTDQLRVPLENVQIQVESVPGRQAALRFYQQFYQSPIAMVRTDDRGEYRFSVPPGSYYVRANVTNVARNLGASAGSNSVYLDTYFPSTPKGAQRVDTQAGRESAHTDIVLLEKRSYSISGVVSGIEPGWTNVLALSQASRVFRNSTVDSSGRFTIRNLAPETYVVYAENTVETVRRRSPAVEIKVADRDVTDLALTVGEVLHLTGHIETTAGVPPASAIKFVPALMFSNAPSFDGVVNAEGDFEIDKVNVERYKMTLTSESKSVYVRSVTLSGNPSADRTVDLRHVGTAAKVVLTTGIGVRLSGKVSAAGGPLALRGMVVVLDPLEKNIPADRNRTFLDNQGAYAFEAVPPGRYRLAPMPGRTAGGLLLATEEIDAALIHSGETIEIAGPGEVKKDLKLEDETSRTKGGNAK